MQGIRKAKKQYRLGGLTADPYDHPIVVITLFGRSWGIYQKITGFETHQLMQSLRRLWINYEAGK